MQTQRTTIIRFPLLIVGLHTPSLERVDSLLHPYDNSLPSESNRLSCAPPLVTGPAFARVRWA
jgi:hypothetical protein